ncbi:hypothetical protein [Desulfotalea psychrophila]|uniref:Uncharacterized protein n=1 Tax=Desulfotalea psychrophila (strain LSv54 / DSM 12343) TaxID=177439 RepID=Q6AM62_DESPS|nr:hypothetical protein [Desulfotalea psychrophila]CAG36563.1 unknown protein [Desulfotalea psychrophila LSv54]
MNNKLDAINILCSKIDSKLSASTLITNFKIIKEQFGDSYMAGFALEDSKKIEKNFDKFEKLFDDLRIQLLI